MSECKVCGGELVDNVCEFCMELKNSKPSWDYIEDEMIRYDKLRDQIAFEYMKDQLARGNDYLENISKQAYLMADAMMKERDKRN